MGVNRRSDDIDDYEEEEEEEQKESKDGTEDKRLAAQVNAVTVLDMIKNLQDEIQDIDAQIDSENKKMKVLKKTEDDESDLEIPVSSAAKISAEETMKELTLQKEDTTMKKVIAQMMLMKQIQKKAEENDRLESALVKLGERRKLINSALMKQKEVADEKRKLAKIEIDRQKEIMLEKEKVIQSILQHEQEKEEREKEKAKKKESIERLRLEEKENKKISIDEQAGLLAAHMKLVDRSNNRILARIEQIKLERQKEAIQEQEKVLLEQQAAISALRSLKNQRRKKQKMKKLKEKNNPLAAALNLPARLNLKQSSALLSLSDQERKQVAEWLDLERNAEILQKTDLKIAEKLRAKTAAETIGTSSALKIKNAAQILLESEDDITDDDIDSILGIDSGLSIDDILNLEDTSLLGLDEDELAFDDYEDDEDYDDDYDEVTYSYEYEDEKDEDSDYEYEEVVTVTKARPPKPVRPNYHKPRPRLRPQKQYHQAPRYPAPRPSYSYAPAPASYSSYPKPYPRQQSSGAQFLEEVTGLLETAQHQPHITLTGSLRDALLRDVDPHVRTEVNRLPGGRVSTKVSIGPPHQSWQSSFQSNRIQPPSFQSHRIQPPSNRFQVASSRSEQPTSAVQPANNRLSVGVNRSQSANSWVRPAEQIDPRTPRRPESRRTSMGTFGDLVSSAEVKDTKERLPIQEISFSEIMGDLLKDKPLPPGLLDNSNQHPGNIRF